MQCFPTSLQLIFSKSDIIKLSLILFTLIMYRFVGLTFADCGVQIGQNLKYGVLQKNDFKIVYVAPMKVHHGGSRENAYKHTWLCDGLLCL
jgi:hypothetical protein